MLLIACLFFIDWNLFEDYAKLLEDMMDGQQNDDEPYSNKGDFNIFNSIEPSAEDIRNNPAKAAHDYAILSFRSRPESAGCKNYAKKAIEIFPDSILGWRQLIQSINLISDGDTCICLFRELLSYAYKYEANETEDIKLVLSFILDMAFQSEQDDVGTFAAEEYFRIDPSELTKPSPGEETNCEYLAVFYVKILGKINRHVYASPQRSIEHLRALYNSSYHQTKEIWSFVELVLSFSHSNSSFKGKLSEIKKKNQFVIDCMMMKKEGSKLLMSMIYEWPSLVIQAAKILNERSFSSENFLEKVPDIEDDHSQRYREKMLQMSQEFLEKGRELLKKRVFSEAIQYFALSRRSYMQSIVPKHRWYIGANYKIASNRATTAKHMSEWNLMRSDIRFAVLLRPDHKRMYSYVPLLVDGFNVPELREEYEKIASDANKENPDWMELSNRTIGFLSLEMIIKAKKGKVTPEVREACIQRGINDFYTSVNRPIGEIKKLSWLSENDIEPKI